MAKKTNLWLSVEDIRRDLFEYSNLPYPVDTSIVAPKTISEYRSRTSKAERPGTFDECTENVFIVGRGRSLSEGIINPGEPVVRDNTNIEKKIRQVTGLGYRNEIIEKAFEGSDSHSDDGETTSKLGFTGTPNLKLISSRSMSAEAGFEPESTKNGSPQ